jgi:hypothetical protein
MPAQEPRGPAGPVLLRLTLEPGDRIRGTLERLGDTRTHTFSGWVDLMSTIDALVGGTRRPDTAGTPSPTEEAERRHAELGEPGPDPVQRPVPDGA